MRILLWEVKYIGFKQSLENRCIDLIKREYFIQAVKLYREETGANLVDAKKYCDKLKERNHL